MANRYWIGGTGNWENTAKWSTTSGGSGGASVPTSSDDVFIDANSGFFDGGRIDNSVGGAVCRDINFTTGSPYAIDFMARGSLYGQITVHGSVNLEPAFNGYRGYGNAVHFEMPVAPKPAAGTTRNIHMNGAQGQNIYIEIGDPFADSNDVFEVLSDMDVHTLSIRGVTFNGNGHVIGAGSLIIQASDIGAAGDCTVNMGGGDWRIGRIAPDEESPFVQAEMDGLTLNAEGSELQFVPRYYGEPYYDPSYSEEMSRRYPIRVGMGRYYPGFTFGDIRVLDLAHVDASRSTYAADYGDDGLPIVYPSIMTCGNIGLGAKSSLLFGDDSEITATGMTTSAESGSQASIGFYNVGDYEYDFYSPGAGFAEDMMVAVQDMDTYSTGYIAMVMSVDGSGGITSLSPPLMSFGSGFEMGWNVAINDMDTFSLYAEATVTDVMLTPEPRNWTLTVAEGDIDVNHISIGGCTATGGANFYAGADSQDVGGNSGWSFTNAPRTPDTSVFYLDGHIDLYQQHSAWTNLANLADGSLSTFAGNYYDSDDWATIIGTNATIKDGNVYSVRIRVYGDEGIYLWGQSAEGVSVFVNSGTPGWSDWVDLKTTPGGWTWKEITEVGVNVDNDDWVVSPARAYRIEIEVTHAPVPGGVVDVEPDGLASGVTMSTVSIGRTVSIALANMASSTTISATTVQKVVALALANLASTTSMASPDFIVTRGLLMANLALSTAMTSPLLNKTTPLSTDDMDILTTVYGIDISGGAELIVDNHSIVVGTSNPTNIVIRNLVTGQLFVGTKTDGLTLGRIGQMSINNLLTSIAIENLDVERLAGLQVQNQSVSTSTSGVTFAVVRNLVTGNLTVLVAENSLSLEKLINIQTANLSLVTSVSGVSLTSEMLLQIASQLVAVKSDSPTMTSLRSMGVEPLSVLTELSSTLAQIGYPVFDIGSDDIYAVGDIPESDYGIVTINNNQIYEVVEQDGI